MSRRTLILLAIAIVIWAAAMIYMFKPGLLSNLFGENKLPSVKKNLERARAKKPENLTPDFIKDYVKICSEGITAPDPLTTYVIKGGREDLNKLILNSNLEVGYIKFGGYIMDKEGEKKVFLDIDGEKVVQDANELIDNRYMIIYMSSIGLIVLDIVKGGLFVIK